MPISKHKYAAWEAIAILTKWHCKPFCLSWWQPGLLSSGFGKPSMPTRHWIGKEKVISHRRAVPHRVLEHRYGFDAATGNTDATTNSDNKIVHGGNLEALKSLLPAYDAKVCSLFTHTREFTITRWKSLMGNPG